MKIMLASLGTRGDMEPFLAVGELLKTRGHEIVCLMPEQFRDLAEESGFRFLSLGTEFIAMLDSEDGKKALGGSGTTFQKLVAYSKLAYTYKNISKLLLQRQYAAIEAEEPDRLVHHAKTMYPLLWGLSHPHKTILLSPVPYIVHPVKEHSHVMFNRNLGPFLNKATYALARWGLVKTVVKAAKTLGLPPVRKRQITKALEHNCAVYAISPTLFPRPVYWPENVHVLGYHERNKAIAWHPHATLLSFLQRYPKFVLVTFGSMSNPEPEIKTAIVLNALTELKIPAIVNTAGGGLIKPEGFASDTIHFVNRIPYDYIFPKTYAVVHHGGSGTTHMALKNGLASLIVPHIIDQYLWNTIASKKGVGPKGPAITKLSAASFTHRLKDLWENTSYKEASKALAEQMAKEDFKEQLVTLIEKSTSIE